MGIALFGIQYSVMLCSNRLELETKLQEIERRKIDEESHRQIERDRAEERVQKANELKDTVEKEALVLR